MNIVSMVVVPALREGRLVALLVVGDREPRQWTPDDARLLEQVAERTLYAVEGARAADALRENRDVLKLAMPIGLVVVGIAGLSVSRTGD
jgi:GAF domain-containing protein